MPQVSPPAALPTDEAARRYPADAALPALDAHAATATSSGLSPTSAANMTSTTHRNLRDANGPTMPRGCLARDRFTPGTRLTEDVARPSGTFRPTVILVVRF
jgi:hypothetical protein